MHAAEQHRAGFDDYEWKKLPKHHFIGDVDGAFFPGFEPMGPREILLPKRRYSAFFATDLGLILHDREISSLVVTGVTTEVCVSTTVREANDRGYECLVLADCVGSYFPEFHDYSLRMIKAQGGIFGWVTNAGNLLSALGRTAPPGR